MANSVNAGQDFEIRNITLNATTDTPIDFNNKFINSVMIRCRTSDIALYLRRSENSNDYFTIPANQTLTLDVAIRNQTQPFYLRSASATPVAEVIGAF